MVFSRLLKQQQKGLLGSPPPPSPALDGFFIFSENIYIGRCVGASPVHHYLAGEIQAYAGKFRVAQLKWIKVFCYPSTTNTL